MANTFKEEYDKTGSAISRQQLNAVMTELNMRNMKKTEGIKFVEGYEKHYKKKKKKNGLYE